jgi:putative hydroxymethylpyrimidine transporter CytX
MSEIHVQEASPIKSETNLSSFVLGALWFGAAISVAEILTGGFLAPLGWPLGLAVILFGHLIGGLVFFGAGWISSRTGLSAIGVSRLSFGKAGPKLFGSINVLQLVGWTAVMVILGSQSLNAISQALWGWQNPWAWKLILGCLLLLWTASGFTGIRWLNTSAVLLVFGLTLVLGWVVAHAVPMAVSVAPQPLRVSDAIEYVVVMPLSWLPLVGDYTRRARSTKKGNLAAVFGYVIASVWMYSIGLFSALDLGTPDPTTQMLKAGLGIVGLAIIAISTATSGFLDVVSSGISFGNVIKKAPERPMALILGGLGLLLALVFPMDQYQNFLYILGAVFAPLYAVLISDWLFLKTQRVRNRTFTLISFVSWALGVGLYYLLQTLSTPLGVTLPTLIAAAIFNVVLKILFTPKNVISAKESSYVEK